VSEVDGWMRNAACDWLEEGAPHALSHSFSLHVSCSSISHRVLCYTISLLHYRGSLRRICCARLHFSHARLVSEQ